MDIIDIIDIMDAIDLDKDNWEINALFILSCCN